MSNSIRQLTTPVVLIDNQKLEDNIKQMANIAQKYKLKIRPHIKTHKSSYIADLQLSAGACGLTVATFNEAMHFIGPKTGSLTVARPMFYTLQIEQIIQKSAQSKVQLNFITDNFENYGPIAQSAKKLNTKAGLFLKIDVGLHRCGLYEHHPELLKLARKIYENPHTEFKGLLSHAGHAYSAKNKAEVVQIAKTEQQILTRVKQQIETENIAVPAISVGATPTVLCSHFYENITEIRPGNYVFMDRTPLRLGLITKQQIALTVLATIISKNNDYFIIDAGSKTLSSDGGAHGSNTMQGYGLAYPADDYLNDEMQLTIEKLSEEHGFVRRSNHNFAIGTQLRIIPNHSCVVANLAKMLCFVENEEIHKGKL